MQSTSSQIYEHLKSLPVGVEFTAMEAWDKLPPSCSKPAVSAFLNRAQKRGMVTLQGTIKKGMGRRSFLFKMLDPTVPFRPKRVAGPGSKKGRVIVGRSHQRPLQEIIPPAVPRPAHPLAEKLLALAIEIENFNIANVSTEALLQEIQRRANR